VILKGNHHSRGHNSTFATKVERLHLRRLPSPQLADIPSTSQTADILFAN